jgi:O-antigen ligase
VLYELALLIARKGHPVGIRHVMLPATFFGVVVLWILCQTVTWPHSALANPIWSLAAETLAKPIAGSISVDPDLTTLALVRLVTASSVFWLALQLCRNGVRAQRLMAAIAVITCCYAAYGLIALKTGPLPFLDTQSNGKLNSTFYYRNSFAAYAGLGLVAIAGLMFDLYLTEVRGVAANWRLEVASLLETTGQRGAVLLLGAFLILVALLFTGSRGAGVATAFALVVLSILAQRGGRHSSRRSLGLLVFAFLVVAGTLLAFGSVLGDSFEQRGVTDASRFSVYLLTLRSILDAPLFGFGYGTFVDVFPMYRDQSLGVYGTWLQAHDTYLEVFQGLGLVFGSLLIASVVLLVLKCIKGSIQRQTNAMIPRIAVACACLLGIHSLVDLSLQIQAVALTFMAILGAGVAQSETSRVSLAD